MGRAIVRFRTTRTTNPHCDVPFSDLRGKYLAARRSSSSQENRANRQENWFKPRKVDVVKRRDTSQHTASEVGLGQGDIAVLSVIHSYIRIDYLGRSLLRSNHEFGGRCQRGATGGSCDSLMYRRTLNSKTIAARVDRTASDPRLGIGVPPIARQCLAGMTGLATQGKKHYFPTTYRVQRRQ